MTSTQPCGDATPRLASARPAPIANTLCMEVVAISIRKTNATVAHAAQAAQPFIGTRVAHAYPTASAIVSDADRRLGDAGARGSLAMANESSPTRPRACLLTAIDDAPSHGLQRPDAMTCERW